MAIRIKGRGGEGVEQMMRRFKKLCEKEGLTKDIKRREYYEKPSERKNRMKRKGIARRIRADQPLGATGPGGPGKGPSRGPGGPGGGGGSGGGSGGGYGSGPR